MDKNDKKYQSLVTFKDQLTSQIKTKEEQLKTVRSEMSKLQKYVETKELEALDKDKEICQLQANLNEHIQLLGRAIEDIQLLSAENKYLLTQLEKDHCGGSILVENQPSLQDMEGEVSNSILMETHSNPLQDSKIGYTSMFVEAKSTVFSTSSILASMRGLSLSHLPPIKQIKKNVQKHKGVRKEIVLQTRYIPSFCSSVGSTLSSIDASVDSSDEDDQVFVIPPTPSPIKTVKLPQNKLETIAEKEREKLCYQSSSGNSSVSSPLSSNESFSSDEDSKMSANLHTTFSIASPDSWVSPELDELQITNHQLFRSGYVLVKIEQDTKSRRSCKEKRMLHYVAQLTGEKYFGSTRFFRALFYKKFGAKGFVLDKSNAEQYLEVDESDIVCHLPHPDEKSNGTLTFNFNFKNMTFIMLK